MKFFGPVMMILLIMLMPLDNASAIPKSVKAKSEFLLAKKKFDSQDYKRAVKHLHNSRILLGNTNSKIQYYLVHSYWKLNDPLKAEQELEKYFDVVPDAQVDTQPYNEMVVLVSEIGQKTMAIREQEEEKKKRKAELDKKRKQEELARLRAEAEADKKRKQEEQARLKAEEEARRIENEKKIAREKRVKAALDKFSKQKKISLAEAKANGIPSPPHTIIMGKKWEVEMKTNSSHFKSLAVIRNEIISETEDSFTTTSKIIKYDVNGENQLATTPGISEPSTTVTFKDGRVQKYGGQEYTSWKATGRNWPIGRIRTGDTWKSSTESTANHAGFSTWTRARTEYKILGFERFLGRDCVVMDNTIKIIVKVDSDSPHKTTTTSKRYYDYNAGVDVYSESDNGETKTSYSLLTLDFQ